MKNNKWIRRRHAFFYAFFRPIGRIYCRFRYGFTAKMNKLEKGKSGVVLCNHVTFGDQFMVASYFNRPLYFLASDDLLNKWTGRYLIWMLGLIPKAKSSKDLTAVRRAKKVVSENGVVAVFPEGNRTYSGELCYVDIAIAKFCKMLKSDVVLYNLTGGFGVLPRFANGARKGKMSGEIREVISAEDVANLSTEELHQRILQGLSVVEPKREYKSKVIAENLERSVYVCPNCGALDSIWTKGNDVFCKECDLHAEYKKDLTFERKAGDFNFERLADWYKWQRTVVIDKFGQDNDIVLANKNVQLFQVDNMQLKVHGNFDVEFSCANGLKVYKTDGSEYLHVPFDDILNMGLMARTKVMIYTKTTIYHLKENNIPINMMKYMNMFYIHKQRKEGITEDGNLFLGL